MKLIQITSLRKKRPLRKPTKRMKPGIANQKMKRNQFWLAQGINAFRRLKPVRPRRAVQPQTDEEAEQKQVIQMRPRLIPYERMYMEYWREWLERANKPSEESVITQPNEEINRVAQPAEETIRPVTTSTPNNKICRTQTEPVGEDIKLPGEEPVTTNPSDEKPYAGEKRFQTHPAGEGIKLPGEGTIRPVTTSTPNKKPYAGEKRFQTHPAGEGIKLPGEEPVTTSQLDEKQVETQPAEGAIEPVTTSQLDEKQVETQPAEGVIKPVTTNPSDEKQAETQPAEGDNEPVTTSPSDEKQVQIQPAEKTTNLPVLVLKSDEISIRKNDVPTTEGLSDGRSARQNKIGVAARTLKSVKQEEEPKETPCEGLDGKIKAAVAKKFAKEKEGNQLSNLKLAKKLEELGPEKDSIVSHLNDDEQKKFNLIESLEKLSIPTIKQVEEEQMRKFQIILKSQTNEHSLKEVEQEQSAEKSESTPQNNSNPETPEQQTTETQTQRRRRPTREEADAYLRRILSDKFTKKVLRAVYLDLSKYDYVRNKTTKTLYVYSKNHMALYKIVNFGNYIIMDYSELEDKKGLVLFQNFEEEKNEFIHFDIKLGKVVGQEDRDEFDFNSMFTDGQKLSTSIDLSTPCTNGDSKLKKSLLKKMIDNSYQSRSVFFLKELNRRQNRALKRHRKIVECAEAQRKKEIELGTLTEERRDKYRLININQINHFVERMAVMRFDNEYDKNSDKYMVKQVKKRKARKMMSIMFHYAELPADLDLKKYSCVDKDFPIKIKDGKKDQIKFNMKRIGPLKEAKKMVDEIVENAEVRIRKPLSWITHPCHYKFKSDYITKAKSYSLYSAEDVMKNRQRCKWAFICNIIRQMYGILVEYEYFSDVYDELIAIYGNPYSESIGSLAFMDFVYDEEEVRKYGKKDIADE